MPFDYSKIKLGWHRDKPDSRDKRFESSLSGTRSPLPDKVDLRKYMPSVYFQGSVGSCTANAIGALFEFCKKKQKQKSFMPSRLFIYYNSRELEDTVKIDNGATIRNVMKACKKLGICNEELWPYDGESALFKKKPEEQCYQEALHHQVLEYSKLDQTIVAMRECLAEGYPFTLGLELYDSFYEEVDEKGIVPLPNTEKEKYIGGHAVLCVGFDHKKKHLIIRNSWGDEWAKNGYCFLPYAYATDPNLADSFWTLRLVE